MYFEGNYKSMKWQEAFFLQYMAGDKPLDLVERYNLNFLFSWVILLKLFNNFLNSFENEC